MFKNILVVLKRLLWKSRFIKTKGTIVTFEPDSEIFIAKEGPKDGGIKFDLNTVVNHIRQQAYLVKELKISIIDARGQEGKIDDSDIFYLGN